MRYENHTVALYSVKHPKGGKKAVFVFVYSTQRIQLWYGNMKYGQYLRVGGRLCGSEYIVCTPDTFHRTVDEWHMDRLKRHLALGRKYWP